VILQEEVSELRFKRAGWRENGVVSISGHDLTPGSSSALFWCWAAGTLLLGTALGFLAGVAYGSRSTERGVRKASKTLASLYALVLDSLENSRKIVALLEGFPKVALTPEQVDHLDSKRGSLLDVVGRIIGTQRDALAKQAEAQSKAPAQPKPLKVAWQRGSFDSLTNLPDRTALDVNLSLMLDAGSRAERSSGLLLVRIDRLDQLKSRFGIAGTDAFIKELAAVISQSVRQQDLTCRLSADSFAVLIPGVDPDNGRKLSLAVRSAVRVHNFRIHDDGPEVLVTASFGFTSCPSHDSPEAALARSGNALSQSARRGRNQLHVFDGEALVHCAAI
jgi:diguanylate cyclase (GGDEF)-like protein